MKKYLIILAVLLYYSSVKAQIDVNLDGTVSIPYTPTVVAMGATDSVIVSTTDAKLRRISFSDFIDGLAGGTATSHAALTGLSADDHVQYHNDARAAAWLSSLYSSLDINDTDDLLTNGSRAMTGDLSLGLHDLTNVYIVRMKNAAGLNTSYIGMSSDNVLTIYPESSGAMNYIYSAGQWQIGGTLAPLISGLGGTGTEMVVVSPSGQMQRQAIPSGADGTETIISNGTNTTVTGSGSVGSPYQINTPSPIASETVFNPVGGYGYKGGEATELESVTVEAALKEVYYEKAGSLILSGNFLYLRSRNGGLNLSTVDLSPILSGSGMTTEQTERLASLGKTKFNTLTVASIAANNAHFTTLGTLDREGKVENFITTTTDITFGSGVTELNTKAIFTKEGAGTTTLSLQSGFDFEGTGYVAGTPTALTPNKKIELTDMESAIVWKKPSGNYGIKTNGEIVDAVVGTDAVYQLAASTLSTAEEDVATTVVSAPPTTLHMAYDGSQKIIGIRFNDITIPQGATINSAYIQFTAEGTSTGVVTLNIYGDDDDDSVFFTSSENTNISKRIKTTATVAWTPSDWSVDQAATANERSADVSSIVEEIVGRVGYVPGTGINLSFIIESTDSTFRNATSWDKNNGLGAPVLHVNYN